ncbi:MAG TPA: serine/threonine-protein kinase [Polyangiales bacterium]|nr:serine/threonine-protein kinase [Polyangiales bacterium]
MQAEALSSQVGETIDGRFRVDALLGEGAVGAVYRVVELSSGRVLALKQWDTSTLDPQVRGRFLREINALVALDHPNIVKVYGHGMVDRVPYMVLEYLEGQTVDALLADGEPLEPELAFEIARQALRAIAYAHQQNVVHRDLKPENIFLTQVGGRPHVKILDYGLAKFMTATGDPTRDKTLTSTGMVVGTPLYMPPEQATGASVDLPVDVYAMGCVLFEMLTGRLPFQGESRFDLMTAHMRDPIPRLADVCPGMRIAPELQTLIDRALAKKQTERFPHAEAMLSALESLPNDPLVAAGVQPSPPRARQAPQAHAARGGMLPLVAIAVVVILGAVAFVLAR